MTFPRHPDPDITSECSEDVVSWAKSPTYIMEKGDMLERTSLYISRLDRPHTREGRDSSINSFSGNSIIPTLIQRKVSAIAVIS